MQKKYIGYIDENKDGINDIFQDANGDGMNDVTGKPYKFPFEFIDKNKDGINDIFQDVNGDGMNDLRPYFEDKDGDGINDNAIDIDKDGINDITGKPTTKQDELFIDEDGDGINDLYLLKEGKDFGFKYYEKGIKRFKRYRIEKKRKGNSK